MFQWGECQSLESLGCTWAVEIITLSPICKSETYSVLFSAINLISYLNFSIIYEFLTYLWGVIESGGYLNMGLTQGITRL